MNGFCHPLFIFFSYKGTIIFCFNRLIISVFTHIGNDNLHLLLSNGASEMRMDMEDFDGNTRYLQYSSFTVGNETSYYQATLDGPSGNVGEHLLFPYFPKPIAL